MILRRFNIRVYGILVNEHGYMLVADELIRGKYTTKFPGGGLELGEGLRDGLAREFQEECGVDVVFNGHAHLYERSYPLKFTVTPKADGSLIGADGSVDGTWLLDRKFDGVNATKPDGVIYLVTGAGGAKLQEQHLPPSGDGWLESTCKHVAELHSFTVCDVDGETITLRQISLEGDELDRLVITK